MAEHLAVRVARGDEILYDGYRTVSPRPIDERTLFDMASITKILATTTLSLILIDRGELSVDDPVGRFFTVGDAQREMTVRHLLTHTMGIGHKSLLGANGDYAGVQDFILRIPPDLPIGSEVQYSCPGFILLGRILEKLLGMPLDRAFLRYVAEPLGLTDTRFLPPEGTFAVNSNRSAADAGKVNDYNCRSLGGVAGNAGIFSDMADLTKFVAHLRAKGAPLYSERVFDAAVKNYTEGMRESRGLGFLFVDGRYEQTGGLFPYGSIGHCGHTGQSFFLDPESGFSVILLSDATVSTVRKYGKERYGEVKAMRRDLHAAIRADLER